MSGPLLDRIDLHVGVRPVPWRDLSAGRSGSTSSAVRDRVMAARERQLARDAGDRRLNAELSDECLDTAVDATPEALRLLGDAVERLGLSARAARRALNVARTIADLAGDARTDEAALAEAVSYRGTVIRASAAVRSGDESTSRTLAVNA